MNFSETLNQLEIRPEVHNGVLCLLDKTDNDHYHVGGFFAISVYSDYGRISNLSWEITQEGKVCIHGMLESTRYETTAKPEKAVWDGNSWNIL